MRVLLLVMTFCISGVITGQNLSPVLISSSGNSHSGSTAMVSWSLGEIAIETIDNGATMLTQGFHQLYDIGTLVDEITGNHDVSIYPNPFSDHVFVDLQNNISFCITVYDLSGKQLLSLADCMGCIKINLSEYQSGVYLLSISDEKFQNIKNFRILKQ